MSLEGLYCNGELQLSIEESELRMSHWVNAPKLTRTLTGEVLFDLTSTLWDVMNAEEKDGILLLTLREYPGDHRASTVAVDPVSGALSVGAARVSRNELQKALRAQRVTPEVTPPGPPAAEEFLQRRIPDLEAELRRLTATSRMPPSAARQLFESYALQTQLADADQRENAQRTFLVNSIVVYRRPEMQLSPLERTPESDLITLALTMHIRADSYLDDDMLKRYAAIKPMLDEYERDTYAPEDRDFYCRLALASVIRDNADDSALRDSAAPGKTIEHLHDDEA